jgi:two-component system, NtrC family, response regulator PilR
VRLISASHQELQTAVEAGRFRQDLYYRLNVIELRMPPLRDRQEDIPLLAEFVGNRLSSTGGYPMPRLSAYAATALRHYAFPGNVRELENILERAFALCDGDLITTEDLNLAPAPEQNGEDPAGRADLPLQDYLDKLERKAIQEALDKTQHNKTAAARILGVTFRSLRYRMERLGIE